MWHQPHYPTLKLEQREREQLAEQYRLVREMKRSTVRPSLSLRERLSERLSMLGRRGQTRSGATASARA